MNKFYITTTLPYVNAEPHIGFALEIVQADALARYHKILGDDVFFNFGTDEHGLKIYRKAQEEGKNVKAYCDEYAEKFIKLRSALNLSYNNFIRTTDPHHISAAQEFWKRCLANGDIYKKFYKIKYCVGCELEKTDSELTDDKCPLHPTLSIEVYEEENYFFKFSKFQKPLLDFYEASPDFVVPNEKFNEIKSFVKKGLEDFSISRLKEKMPWGVDVPNDPKHTMYVWFDALINYISALGWPEDEKKFSEFWPGIQVAGKDNLRQQTAIWQAMLLSAGLPNSKQIFIHGFITVDGQKISKSLGNIIDPIKLAEKYGTDALRYYLLREIPPYSDGDFSERRFREIYNSDLANGLGNLASRVAKLSESCNIELNPDPNGFPKEINNYLTKFEFDKATGYIWELIKRIDKDINIKEPWKINDENEKQKAVLGFAKDVYLVGSLLKPFLPETADAILKQFSGKIKSGKSLFPRLV